MGLKQYIDNKIQKEASNQFRNIGYFLKSANSNCGGLAKITQIKDGKYVVQLADGTTKEIDPSGARGVGPDGIIYLSGDLQVF